MQELVTDCPRCGAREHTFVVKTFLRTHTEYNWQQHFESYCICKNCVRGTIFLLSQRDADHKQLFSKMESLKSHEGSINQIMRVEGFINKRNNAALPAPAYTPDNIASVFREGSESVLGGCPNAAAAMFRLCVDLTTKALLPEGDAEGLNQKVKTRLWDRLCWLFETQRLPASLESLANCIRHDGNDGAHDGTLTKDDADDLLEFTTLLLERVYTEPQKLILAEERRQIRRKQKTPE